MSLYFLDTPGAKSLTYGFEVQFSSPSGQQTKNMLLAFSEGGFARDFLMEEGSWRVAITSHSSIILLVSLLRKAILVIACGYNEH